MYYLVLLLILYFENVLGRDIDQESSVIIEAGQSHCFFQDILKGESLDLEYQVTDASQGEFVISFTLADPNGKLLKTEKDKTSSSHNIMNLETAGDYKFCFYNINKFFSRKTVFFSYEVVNDEDYDDKAMWGDDVVEKFEPDQDEYEVKLEDIRQSVNKIRVRLIKTRTIQDVVRAHAAKDRNIVERNFTLVNRFSLLNVIVMLITGSIQVILLRSLFDEKSRFHKKW